MLAVGERTLVASIFAAADPGRPALIDGDRAVSYADLAALIAAKHDELGLSSRSLVVLETSNSIQFVATYLALLGAGHVPLLAGSHVERLIDAWRPAALVHTRATGVEVEHLRVETRELHPDLALLLSTSGSTGAPKLVRLSDRNLASNASAIVRFLGLTADDQGITSLPLHYCYGLSVLHSHLVAGAAVMLTDASVVDPCFIAAMRDHGVTNLAGVPHVFELLERAGPERIRVPTLRLMTQAGGRLAPQRVEQWTRRAEEWDAEFFVMYGQTEATARMAYLPPALAVRRPEAIGMPIPGGSLHLEPVDGMPADVGELVYRGPNVMLGYAESDADLALGATLTELRTGDVGRFHADDGVFEIVGRRSRFVKPFGVRVDLDRVECELSQSYGDVAVSGDDEHLTVVATGASVEVVRRAVAELTALPDALVTVDSGPIPRTESGKVDYEAVRRTGEALRANSARPERAADAGSVADIFAELLGRSDVTAASTFVSLGGDSLHYVECSLRLERLLGHVPPDWHLRSVADLGSTARQRRIPRLDTTVVLRAVGICTIVSTHMGLRYFPGGAHLLLALVGFNLSRFQLPIAATAERVRAGLRTAARVAVPTVLWVVVGMMLVGRYSGGTLALVNNYVGPRTHDNGRWHFWFVEVFVHLTVITTFVLAIPAVRRLERRFRYGFPLAVLLLLFVLRLDWADLGDAYNLRFRTHGVAFFFVLGWLVHRARSWWQRLLTSALCLFTVLEFFDRSQRELFIAGCLVALVWLREVPCPRPLMRPIAAIAAASLWILITHFTVWPPLDRALPREWAYVLTIAAGVAAWALVEQLTRLTRRLRELRRQRAHLPALRSQFRVTGAQSVV